MLHSILFHVLFLKDHQRVGAARTDDGFRMRLEWYRFAPRRAFVISVSRGRTEMC